MGKRSKLVFGIFLVILLISGVSAVEGSVTSSDNSKEFNLNGESHSVELEGLDGGAIIILDGAKSEYVRGLDREGYNYGIGKGDRFTNNGVTVEVTDSGYDQEAEESFIDFRAFEEKNIKKILEKQERQFHINGETHVLALKHQDGGAAIKLNDKEANELKTGDTVKTDNAELEVVEYGNEEYNGEEKAFMNFKIRSTFQKFFNSDIEVFESDNLKISVKTNVEAENELESIEWDLNNDGDIEGKGREVAYTYQKGGEKKVEMRAYDSEGNSVKKEKTVEVSSGNEDKINAEKVEVDREWVDGDADYSKAETAGDSLITSSSKGAVYAFDGSGSELWSGEYGRHVAVENGEMFTNKLEPSGHGGNDSYMVSRGLESQERKFKEITEIAMTGLDAGNGNAVYRAQDHVVGFSTSGEYQWWNSESFSNNVNSIKVVEDKVLVGGEGGKLAVLDPDSGEELWSKEFEDPINALDYRNKEIYVGVGQKIHVFDSDGQRAGIEELSLEDNYQNSNMVIRDIELGDKGLIIATKSGNIFEINRENGEEDWRFKDQDYSNLKDLEVKENRIYSIYDQKLISYSFETEDSEADGGSAEEDEDSEDQSDNDDSDQDSGGSESGDNGDSEDNEDSGSGEDSSDQEDSGQDGDSDDESDDDQASGEDDEEDSSNEGQESGESEQEEDTENSGENRFTVEPSRLKKGETVEISTTVNDKIAEKGYKIIIKDREDSSVFKSDTLNKGKTVSVKLDTAGTLKVVMLPEGGLVDSLVSALTGKDALHKERVVVEKDQSAWEAHCSSKGYGTTFKSKDSCIKEQIVPKCFEGSIDDDCNEIGQSLCQDLLEYDYNPEKAKCVS